MHIHILGICGTFMGGVAQLAQALGHRVTGCDTQVYPPMSDQLRNAGISLTEGFEADQISLSPDLWVVGNVARRGLPLVEALINAKAPMVSGPQFMADQILAKNRVIAVAGTHGKTTTSALVAYLLDACGFSPGFLIGGVPENFGQSARPAAPGAPFVIEADEYDTAFFDKRSKFLHYRADVAILNNLEFDHADIFPDLQAIENQFHHWIRTLPSAGTLWVKAGEPALDRVLARGCYTPTYRFDDQAQPNAARPDCRLLVCAQATDLSATQEQFDTLSIWLDGQQIGDVQSPLWGNHNRANLAAALGAAMSVGADLHQMLKAVPEFKGVKRRMQLRGQAHDVRIFDDFAHHPTAIATTIEGLRRFLRPKGRILAVLEPRSNTMKMGVMRSRLADSLAQADLVFGFSGGLDWSLEESLTTLGARARVFSTLAELIKAVVESAQPGDDILVMSNGGFGGIHSQLLEQLQSTSASIPGR